MYFLNNILFILPLGISNKSNNKSGNETITWFAAK